MPAATAATRSLSCARVCAMPVSSVGVSACVAITARVGKVSEQSMTLATMPCSSSFAPHGHAVAVATDPAAHVLDQLEEARVALTAALDASARVRDRDPAAEDGGRRGRIASPR